MKITNEGIKAELDILVEQILTCKDLEKLKEVTRMNYPDMAREFNSQVKLDSSEEKQGQWIKHNGNEMPNNVRDSTFVDIKFIHGRELLHVSPLNFSWENWILYEEKGHEHIIAYRIIPEQKEEEENIYKAGTTNPKEYYLREISIKEPKKQTLLEYSKDKFTFCDVPEDGIAYQIFKIISEYLEQSYK